MHFSAPIVLIAGITAVHSYVVERDASVILGVFKNVQGDIDGLDSAVKAWTKDPSKVLDGSNKLVATITKGTTTVKGSPNLSLSDATSLLGPVKELKTHAQTLVTDLKGKKSSVIEKGGFCEAVSGQITAIGGKSKSLIDATISKVPASAQEIAKEQAQGFIDILNDAQTAFSPANCKNA